MAQDQSVDFDGLPSPVQDAQAEEDAWGTLLWLLFGGLVVGLSLLGMATVVVRWATATLRW